MMRAILARLILAVSFGVTILVAKLGRRPSLPPRWRPSGRVALTARFDSVNWFRSHVLPLARCGLTEVIVVSDAVQPAEKGVRFFCPPRWAQMILGRAMSKLLWMLMAGVRFRPDAYMGYHLFPGALTALIAARVFGRPCCYQMTGGPVELIGGGFGNENFLMSALGSPSAFLERLALCIARTFERVIVRGANAQRYLSDRGIERVVRIIPGSVQDFPKNGIAQRDIDLVFVGRLTAIKQPLQFVEIAAAVAEPGRPLRAVVVGEGPMRDSMAETAMRLGVTRYIEFLGQVANVSEVLVRSKVFILTSRTEGLSIALAEAMAAGAVPIVADVGDLCALVEDDCNGFLIPPDCIGMYANRIRCLLADADRWLMMSQHSVEAAKRKHAVSVVADAWRSCFADLLPQNSPGVLDEALASQVTQWPQAQPSGLVASDGGDTSMRQVGSGSKHVA